MFRKNRELIEKFISDRFASRLEGIRTDVAIVALKAQSAVAVVGEARELIAVDRPKVAPDGVPARSGIDTKPGSVSGRAARGSRKVGKGVAGIFLGISSGGVEL